MARTEVFERPGARQREFLSDGEACAEDQTAGKVLAVTGRNLSAVEELMRAFFNLLAKEAQACFLSYLVPGVVLFGAAVFWLALDSGIRHKSFGVVWLAVAAMEMAVFWLLSRPISFERCCQASFVGVVGIALWLMLLLSHAPVSLPLWMALMGVAVLGVSHLPWPAHYSAILAFFFCVIVVLAALSGPAYWVLLGLVPPFIFVPLRLAADRGLSFISRLAQVFLSRYCESSSADALTTLRLLAWQAALLMDSRRALLSFGGREAEVLARGRIQCSRVDNVFLRGLDQRAEDINEAQGILTGGELGGQFLSACHDWFNRVPNRLFFAKFTAIVESVEERVYLYVPLSFSTVVAGKDKTYRALLNLVLVVRIFLAAARSRFVSSDALLLSQRSVSEREEELNHLIHLVNNIAQDIAIHCDDLRVAAINMQGAGREEAERSPAELEAVIGNLAAASRMLSTEVSDVKLLKELSRLRNFKHQEEVAVAPLLEEISAYGSYRLKKGQAKLEIANRTEASCGVSVVSCDFLQTVLRLLVRQAGSGANRNQTVAMTVWLDGKSVVFQMLGPGAALDSEAQSQILGAETPGLLSDRMVLNLRAAVNLARLSAGEFLIESPLTEGIGKFVLTLPKTEIGAGSLRCRRETMSERWVLCVDDNPQVTAFYGRVAEALSFKYALAASVQEAKLVMEGRGRPYLVIADIQLGETSGLELVRYVRDKFGVRPPVLVVSGNTNERTQRMAAAAGASRFLTKPVSRARLFAEIERVLREQAS